MAEATEKTGKCKLCMRIYVLQKSHIIPRFIRRATNTGGAVEHPRYYTGESRKFVKLQQDLPKRTWLCQKCEQLFSRSEKHFSETVYQDILSGRTGSQRINDEHVHRFLVSMAWRTWHWYEDRESERFSIASNEDRWMEAENVWRTYLLGKRTDVGEFKQHMVMQGGQIADHAGRVVGLQNYYWTRGYNLDVLGHGGSNEEILMVYAKIPKIAMFGMVDQAKSGYWHGTLVEPGQVDAWSSPNATVPSALLKYMTGQSEKMLRVIGDVPEALKTKTRQRMNTLIKREGDHYLARDAVQSLVADDLMEFPEDSIVTDALVWAAKESDPRARKISELLGQLSEAEMKSLHQETNRIAIRCKALDVEEKFSLLSDGRDEAKESDIAILIGVEVFRTRDRAMERSLLPLIFGMDEEEITVAIGAEIVSVPMNFAERGIRYCT